MSLFSATHHLGIHVLRLTNRYDELSKTGMWKIVIFPIDGKSDLQVGAQPQYLYL